MRTFLVTKEEWEIFKILCPKELMDIYLDKNIDLCIGKNVGYALNALGFHGLAYDFLEMGLMKEEQENLSCNNEDVIPYVRMFLGNIKSEGLKALFSQKAQDLIPYENDISTESKRSTAALWEEWEVFKILCSPKIRLLTERDNLSAKEHMALIAALRTLGFLSLADDIYLCEYAEKFEEDVLDDDVFDEADCHITLFLNSLKSVGMREVFEANIQKN